MRDYKLIPQTDKPGVFVMDENNGILLDCRLLGNVMFSQFKVGDVLLLRQPDVGPRRVGRPGRREGEEEEERREPDRRSASSALDGPHRPLPATSRS